MNIRSIIISASLVVGVAAAAAFFAPQLATAFPLLRHWDMPSAGETTDVNEAGAGGLIGTGGPRHYGVQCAHCHINGEGLITLTFDASPPWTQSGNDLLYVPGQKYDIVVQMGGTHVASDPENQNGFAASFEDAGGMLMGYLESDVPGVNQASCDQAPVNDPGGTTYMVGNCDFITSSLATDATQWQFSWTAPSDGEVTLWYGGVDGDWLAENSTNDDVVQGSITLLPE
jgi:hypothetical protein